MRKFCTLCLAEEGHITIQVASTSYSVIERQERGDNLTCAEVNRHKDKMHKLVCGKACAS